MEQKPVYKELQIPEKKRKGILFMRKIRKNGIIQKYKKIEEGRHQKKHIKDKCRNICRHK